VCVCVCACVCVRVVAADLHPHIGSLVVLVSAVLLCLSRMYLWGLWHVHATM